MTRFDTTVTTVRQVAPGFIELGFTWPAHLQVPLPGQFFTVKTGGSKYDPVLRRPFAFSSFGSDSTAYSIIQMKGRGTAWLGGRRTGDPLDVMGPLGTAFSAPPASASPVLLAGGVGLGPMLYLMESLVRQAADGACAAPVLAAGFRTASLVPAIGLPAGTVICTDDGSAGFRGTVVDWLAGTATDAPPYLYACGPAPMLAAAAGLARATGARYEASLEQWMACGVGACAGCAVRLVSGDYIKACVDGPVYDGLLVDWESYR